MNVQFKSSEEFKKLIIQLGFSQSSLARRLNKSRFFIHTVLKRNSINPENAKMICDLLKKDFNEIFLIKVSTEMDKKPKTA